MSDWYTPDGKFKAMRLQLSSGPVPDWVMQIEKRAAEAHAEIRAAGIAARRSIGQVLRRAREAELARQQKRLIWFRAPLSETVGRVRSYAEFLADTDK